jgi:diguanylate cyclase (GGDEF)-like protein
LFGDRASEDEATIARRVSDAERLGREGARRDHEAARRDLAAEARDRAAEKRDRQLTIREASLKGPPVLDRLRAELKALRARAAAHRAQAAAHRRLAARDREQAARERGELLEALRRSHFDDLTGAHRRGYGEIVLRDEIERARRSDGRLALGFVDVDGLKEVNDRDGHLAGDRLLCDVVESIRANIRSYEPVIRLGGDEFAFAMSGFDADAMRERCAVIKADLGRRPAAGKITVGIAELEPGDDLKDLLSRADAALVNARASDERASDGVRRQPAGDRI